MSEGYDKQVTDTPAYDETVIDKLVCTTCGATKDAPAGHIGCRQVIQMARLGNHNRNPVRLFAAAAVFIGRRCHPFRRAASFLPGCKSLTVTERHAAGKRHGKRRRSGIRVPYC